MEISFPIIYLYTILFISQYFVQDIIRMTFMGTRYDAHSIKSSDVLYAYLDVTKRYFTSSYQKQTETMYWENYTYIPEYKTENKRIKVLETGTYIISKHDDFQTSFISSILK